MAMAKEHAPPMFDLKFRASCGLAGRNRELPAAANSYDC